MRPFSTLFIAAAFALSVNAVAADKRAISASIQTCTNSIVFTADQLKDVTDAVATFNSAGGLAEAINIYIIAEELGTRVKKASNDCCAETLAFTPEEAKVIFDTVASFVPKTKESLTQLQNKKPEFDKIDVSFAIKDKIDDLATQTMTLATCLVKKVPSSSTSYLKDANNFFTEVDAAFAAAKTTYSTV